MTITQWHVWASFLRLNAFGVNIVSGIMPISDPFRHFSENCHPKKLFRAECGRVEHRRS